MGVSISEIWMLQVALTNNAIPNAYLRSKAQVLVNQFLSGDQYSWENQLQWTYGGHAWVEKADALLAQIAAMNAAGKKPKPNFKVIAQWFSFNKKPQQFTLPSGYLQLKAAPMDGKNPGAVYLSVNGVYMGKISVFGVLSPLTSLDPFEGEVYDALNAFAASVAPAVQAAGFSEEAEIKSPKGYSVSVPVPVQQLGMLEDVFVDVSEEMKKQIVAAIAAKFNKGGQW